MEIDYSLSYWDTMTAVSAKLNDLGAPENACVERRLYPVLDRLMLRPEGEPDTADLVGYELDKLRTEYAAAESRLTLVRTQRDEEVAKASELRQTIAELQADLEAERAQLAAAKPIRTDAVKLAFSVLECRVDEYGDAKLAIAVLREALA